MSKKENKTIINNIKEVNLEIDYDKLAQAIVEAQSKINRINEDSKPKQKYISGFYKYVIEFTFLLIIIIGIAAFMLSTLYLKTHFAEFAFHTFDGMKKIIVIIEFIVLSIVVTIYSGLSLKEADKFNDVNTLSSMFSNIVAFVALIVAAIALIKD